MAAYEFTIRIAAPPERVFDLWTDLDRMKEWVGGVTKVTDRTGPLDRPGTRYTVWFGRMASPAEVIEVDRPRVFRTRFGNRLLRGESGMTLEPDGAGTILTQWFRTEGLIPALMARIFATGSYRGSFRGELEAFARIAEREAGSTRA
jgi:polyketide cyclase/dehydrase/lipid transport protein